MNFNLFGYGLWQRMAEDLTITCLDLGARRGVINDLQLIGPVVRAIGFEPDKKEFEKLKGNIPNQDIPWKSLDYIPVAIGEPQENRPFYLYDRGGNCSLYRGDADLVKNFARDDYFSGEREIEVDTSAMDDVAQEFDFENAEFLKMDVQGAELEVLETGEKLVKESLLAIRTEVSFREIYKEQPLFYEINDFLNNSGFIFMGFEESHFWRLNTRVKSPFLSREFPFYSRGELIHADALYFKRLPFDSPDQIDVKRWIKAGLLYISYGYLDWAARCWNQPPVKNYLKDKYKITPRKLLFSLGRKVFLKRTWKKIRNSMSRTKYACQLLITE